MNTSECMEDTIFNRNFRDRNGNMVLGFWASLTLLNWKQWFLAPCSLGVARAFQGINYFRQSLSLVVLLGASATKIH